MDILKDLITKDYFILFLVIGLGIAIGKIKIRGLYFDLSAVIFVAIFFSILSRKVCKLNFIGFNFC